VRRYFGTDGVRGVVGKDLTADLVERLGRAFALTRSGRVLIGRDTRESGPLLEAALARGLAAGGARAIVAGILPTPAVALLATDAGAAVSASHNPPEYNGVKFFDGGYKLRDAQEEVIEARMDDPPAPDPGQVETATGLAELYVSTVCERFGRALGGLRMAVDCAHGAMYEVAPAALERAGAQVTALAAEPDGSRINAGCGATDLSLIRDAVRRGDFDLGVAFDGDGDRMLAVDAEGDELDGDVILAILALHLGVELVVVTQMTNLGFDRLMQERGIRVVRTAVGDRYVLEALRREGGLLGGEQSGHLLWLDGHTSGDGLAAALLLAGAVAESGKSVRELAAVLERFPQAKENVPVRSRELTPAVREEIARIEGGLGPNGRILVRPSGTEPVVRVLAEAETAQKARDLCARIASLVNQELG
jgi:phosphoglucosamine mutase